ncbi:MAG: cytochrome P450 [Granulosicoccus sp.]
MPDTSVPNRRWQTQLIVPSSKPYSVLHGLFVLRQNPARWWSSQMYDEGVRKNRIAGRNFVHVARPELARIVLLDSASSFGRSFILQRVLQPAMGNGLLTSDGEVWRRQRRLLAPVFRKNTLNQFVPAIDRHAIDCRDQLLKEDGNVASLAPITAHATLGIIFEILFGDTDMDRESVISDIDTFLTRFGKPDTLQLLGVPDYIPRFGARRSLEKIVRRLRSQCQNAIDLQRAEGRVDTGGLVGRLLSAIDPDTGDRLNDESIIDNVITFMGAGHETTAVALAWTLYAIAHQPTLAARLAEESLTVLGDEPASTDIIDALTLHRQSIQESMRLYPPAAAIVRTVTKDVRVGPFELEPGDHVTIATMPMHRNPRWWPEPNVFDETRFEPAAVAARDRFAFLPFGDGPQICIGATFALNEAVLILARLTPALRFTPVDDGAEPEPILNVTLRPSDGVRLKVNRAMPQH